jgi:hypothetical protein
LFTTCLPSYMAEVLDFDIKSVGWFSPYLRGFNNFSLIIKNNLKIILKNGELSSIPFLACWLFILISAVISDLLIQKKKLSKQNVRKLFNTVGFVIPVLTFIGLMFVTSSSRVIGFCLVLVNITFR